MRFYHNSLEMIKEVERDLAEMGIEYQSYSVQDQKVKDDDSFMTKEIMGYAYKLLPMKNEYADLEEMLEYMKQDNDYIEWVHREVLERTSGIPQNPGIAWSRYRSYWMQYLRDDDKFAYTYCERIGNQLNYIIEELRRNPNTRQAVVTIYDQNKDLMNWGGRDRIPCSMSYHFMLRDSHLHMMYHQRSCDFYNFFAADVYLTINLQLYVMHILNDVHGKSIKIGSFTHYLDSLHAFKKDMAHVF